MPLTSCVTSAKKTSLTEDASGGTKRMLRAMEKKNLTIMSEDILGRNIRL